MPVLKKCAGLHTFKNELQLPEGALEVADNVVIDADDTIESRRGFAEFGDQMNIADTRAKQLFSYKSRILRHYDDVLQFDSNGNGSFSTFDGTYTELESGLRLKAIESQGNFYFTTDEGIKKISATSPSDFSTAAGYITDAGIPEAVDMTASLLFASGGFLPPQSKCAYRVLWGTRDANNILHLGAPSSRTILENTSDQVINNERFIIDFTGGGGASETDVQGTYILFSSEDVDYYLWFSNAANPTAPQTSETVGRTAIEVDVDALGASTSSIVAVTANAISTLGNLFSVEISGDAITVENQQDGADTTDAAAQSGGITNVSVVVSSQGMVTEGNYANATVTATIPNGVDSTDFFYQLYRTAASTVTTGLTLDEIEPGDEMNLAYEANLTATDISNGYIEVEDITSEDFRASGAFLYTNPNTGEGILQSNTRPPIATDVESFRNSVFYSNTKTAHSLQTNLLSVSGFVSGVSNFIVGNSDGIREYTFIGAQGSFEIVTDTFANTTADSIILMDSANDERNYYFWFDKSSGTDPAITEREGVRVDISEATSATDVAALLVLALNTTPDFSASNIGSTISVDFAKNGNTVTPTFGSPAPGGAWTIQTYVAGDGEDAASQEVLLSNVASVGISIDETARSLVRVINQDASSAVNAFYLSGVDDLPGIIQLKARNLEDKKFYLATGDTAITNKWNPVLPETEAITAITAGDPATITASGHGLYTGQEVFIYGTDSTPAILGAYAATVVDPNDFTVPVLVTTGGTTGFYFPTDVASDNEQTLNRLYYSKINQPEAVPILNYIDIGRGDKAIKRIVALRDNLFVLKEDGVYIVTGSSAPNFSSRLLDGSLAVVAADTAAVLNNQIYCLSSEGVVAITEGGASLVSRPIEDKIKAFSNFRYPDYTTISFGVSYDSDRSYTLWCPELTTDTVSTQAYRYNVFTKTWTRWTKPATCGIVAEDDRLYIGDGVRNYVDQERKNAEREDYADRDFVVEIPQDSVETDNIKLTDASDVEIGDVILQTQYITIRQVQRLLQKLDIDPGLDDIDYSSLTPVLGDQMNLVLDDINAKLVADDASGIITSQTFSTDFATMQTEYNDMIAELNNTVSDTAYKNYVDSIGTTPFEVIVMGKDLQNISLVYTHDCKLFIAGVVTVFKAIKNTVQWSSLDFGAADQLKQIREGAIMMDQTNFHDAIIGFATDLSQNFELITKNGDGIGYWGDRDFGTVTGINWGGCGNEAPLRTTLPKQKQKCRFVKVLFIHKNAREIYRIVGISLEVRPISTRAYR